MPRFAFKVDYDGGPFHGWQRQTDLPTVQGAIETALSRLQPGEHTIAAAGRTDTGVHASGQVAHADLHRDWDPFRLSEALNHHLRPLPVAITACVRVPDQWHARFSAVHRGYHFRLINRRAPLTRDLGQAWRVKFPLDIDRMRAGAERLLGHHDFTTFRSSICQANSPVRTLDRFDITEHHTVAGRELHFHLRARAFLHNQVRSMVGTLERVGAGAWSPDDVTKALEAKDRRACGPVCPPDGLTLCDVGYDPNPFGPTTELPPTF